MRTRRGRDAFHDAVVDAAIGGIHGNVGRLARADAVELRFLVVRFDIGRIEGDERKEPRARLHILAHLHGLVADHAVERRPDCRVAQVEQRLVQARLQLGPNTLGFLHLRVQHREIGLRRSLRGFRSLDGGFSLIAFRPGQVKLLLAAIFLLRQGLCAFEIRRRAHEARLRGGDLRLRLIDHGQLCDRLLFQPFDCRVLGRELVPGRIDGDRVIAVVDLGEDIASADADVVLDGNGGDDAGDLGRYHGEVRLHIGIVGRNGRTGLRSTSSGHNSRRSRARRSCRAGGGCGACGALWRHQAPPGRELDRKPPLESQTPLLPCAGSWLPLRSHRQRQALPRPPGLSGRSAGRSNPFSSYFALDYSPAKGPSLYRTVRFNSQ